MAEESLRNKTVKGLGWSFGGSLASYSITFLVGIVLARLLSPEEYGLIGIITIFITIFNTLADSGFSNALIRKVDATEDDYNTVFLVNLVVSIGLYAVLFLVSPLIADYFSNKHLTSLTRSMGICVILNALSLIQSTLLTKEIDFKTITKCQIVSSFLSGIIGIWMAFASYGSVRKTGCTD